MCNFLHCTHILVLIANCFCIGLKTLQLLFSSFTHMWNAARAISRKKAKKNKKNQLSQDHSGVDFTGRLQSNPGVVLLCQHSRHSKRNITSQYLLPGNGPQKITRRTPCTFMFRRLGAAPPDGGFEPEPDSYLSAWTHRFLCAVSIISKCQWAMPSNPTTHSAVGVNTESRIAADSPALVRHFSMCAKVAVVRCEQPRNTALWFSTRHQQRLQVWRAPSTIQKVVKLSISE